MSFERKESTDRYHLYLNDVEKIQMPMFLELNSDSFSFLEQGKNINLHCSRECGQFVLMLPE